MTAVIWLYEHILSILAVCVAFGFIIAIHELGHFMMARRVGIRCPRFALGFGPKLFSFFWRGTEFSVRLFPLGGYVMMLGEDPDADEKQSEFSAVSRYVPEGVLPASRDDVVAAMEAQTQIDVSSPEEAKHFRSAVEHMRYNPNKMYNTPRELEGNFNDATVPARMGVILGGVTMNFISALILFWIIGACYGLVDLSPKSLPLVMKVFNNSPAATAGLAYGDEITAVDGLPIVSGSEMVEALGRHPAESVQLEIRRGSKKLQVDVLPNALIGSMVFHPNSVEDGLPKVVEINALGGDSTIPIKAGDVITGIDGRPVANLNELIAGFKERSAQELAKHPTAESCPVTLGVKGRGDVKLQMAPAELLPLGKIGIMPAQVTEFKFIEHTTNEVQSVADGSAAATIGIKAGDKLFYVNGARVSDLDSLNEVLLATRPSINADHPLVFEILRDKQHVTVTSEEGYADGIAMGLTMRPITMGLVVGNSFKLIGRLIIAPVIIVEQMLTKMLSPDLVKASMSGPLGIMQMIFELSNDGLGKLLYITALINAAVGAFNVLPFPALDGARFCVLFIGWVRGREVDPRKEAMVHNIGLIILLVLVLLVTFLDIQRLYAGVPLTK